jgi:hypothetical protein
VTPWSAPKPYVPWSLCPARVRPAGHCLRGLFQQIEGGFTVEQVKGEVADRARIAERVEEKLGDLPHHGWRGLLLLQRLMRLTEPKVADQRIRRSAGRTMHCFGDTNPRWAAGPPRRFSTPARDTLAMGTGSIRCVSSCARRRAGVGAVVLGAAKI